MSIEEAEQYLAILKASYDYTPQSDDEIAITQDQRLLLLEKVDGDWWKVKVTGNEEETENQSGLVPAAYVEQAVHTSVVRALYDYEAAAPGELSVHENDILLVFETEDDWLLVQDSQSGGKAGYVPGNYVEVVDEDVVKESTSSPNRIIVPDSPPKPAYVDPADMVASSKVTADDIKTWSVSELDKKGKKKKGTLGIGNGSLFFASESDKTPVQKWDIRDVADVSSEKAKHVKIDIGGPSPASLHFHTSSREHSDSILEKLATSRALSVPPRESERLIDQTGPSSPTKKPSVHFSPAAPTIIPDPEEPEEEPQAEDEEGLVHALYDFNADGEDELTVKEGERLIILEKDGEEWWKCRNADGVEGVVPASYLELIPRNQDLANGDAAADIPRAEEERHGKQEEERLEQQRREREREEDNQRLKAAAAAATLKMEAQSKVKDTTAATHPERLKKKTAAPPILSDSELPQQSSHDPRSSSDINRPSPESTRMWHDRTGQFRVEAAFLGFNNGKLRLHKVNGVIVEVPSEKMSLDDMRYVEKLMEKKTKASGISHGVSDDDIPLALSKNVKTTPKATNSSKKMLQIDWFDFFLSAGCEVDDCTRYAAAFERDKIDETLLNDITEGTMRSLGLREGDIIRVKKAIDKRNPTDNLQKQNTFLQEQIRRDEELARQLQAQENATATAPNLFAGPGGVLKPRRGRPQPSKSLPPTNVDLTAISSPSQVKGDEPPRVGTSSPIPPRPSSTSASASITSGFEDDAWTNRPSSTKPSKSTSPSSVPVSSAISPPSPAPTPTSPPKPGSTQTIPPSAQDGKGPSNLAKTTEADIFHQLARLSDLRRNPSPQEQTMPKPTIVQPPGYQAGLGMGSSPLPLAQLANPTFISPPPNQTSNGPRGPYAPVPANQGLLQPLIPTQTGFGGFIPTKPTQSPSPFQVQLSPPSFVPPQTTGFHTPSPVMTHPTGAFGNFGGVPFSGPGPIISQPPALNLQMPFSNARGHNSLPPSNSDKDTSPASVFAQMKSGTFANEDNPSGLNGQTTSWGHQPYQTYMGH